MTLPAHSTLYSIFVCSLNIFCIVLFTFLLLLFICLYFASNSLFARFPVYFLHSFSFFRFSVSLLRRHDCFHSLGVGGDCCCFCWRCRPFCRRFLFCFASCKTPFSCWAPRARTHSTAYHPMAVEFTLVTHHFHSLPLPYSFSVLSYLFSITYCFIWISGGGEKKRRGESLSLSLSFSLFISLFLTVGSFSVGPVCCTHSNKGRERERVSILSVCFLQFVSCSIFLS